MQPQGQHRAVAHCLESGPCAKATASLLRLGCWADATNLCSRWLNRAVLLVFVFFQFLFGRERYFFHEATIATSKAFFFGLQGNCPPSVRWWRYRTNLFFVCCQLEICWLLDLSFKHCGVWATLCFASHLLGFASSCVACTLGILPLCCVGLSWAIFCLVKMDKLDYVLVSDCLDLLLVLLNTPLHPLLSTLLGWAKHWSCFARLKSVHAWLWTINCLVSCMFCLTGWLYAAFLVCRSTSCLGCLLVVIR